MTAAAPPTTPLGTDRNNLAPVRGEGWWAGQRDVDDSVRLTTQGPLRGGSNRACRTGKKAKTHLLFPSLRRASQPALKPDTAREQTVIGRRVCLSDTRSSQSGGERARRAGESSSGTGKVPLKRRSDGLLAAERILSLLTSPVQVLKSMAVSIPL
ncbi:hypothetical protein SKAU_G00255820 [Synaphobranchus kaupii]|uniref:Uncharacterized protein n=1 Tax=Synaphobranchus kaupii TaxID=118154 RepID=A0A9Q1ISD0_SYNKA|nr:hypothetical protein SKAU_G00255820 [Synaphobranchus kaupii]